MLQFREAERLSLGQHAIDSLGVHGPSLPAQQHMDAPVAIAHPRRRGLLDPGFQGSLVAALRLVVMH